MSVLTFLGEPSLCDLPASPNPPRGYFQALANPRIVRCPGHELPNPAIRGDRLEGHIDMRIVLSPYQVQ